MIDYKKELEAASRSMILIHEPAILIKMIVRMIVRKVKVRHAAILLYDKVKNTYVLTISRGESGLKIPVGFARVDPNSALIRFFDIEKNKVLTSESGALVYGEINNLIWKESVLKNGVDIKELLHDVSEQMRIFDAEVCIPSYFQDSLLGVLLLGAKTSGEKFQQEELDFFSALASDVAMAIRNAQLFADLRNQLDRNRELFIQTTIALASAIEAKDLYTRGHTERVTKLSLGITGRLILNRAFSISEDFLENLHIASLLHDIGKIGIPEIILNKIEKLTDEEFKIIREHPMKGVTILQPIKELSECIQGVKYHHERYDGTGYPEGLKGDQIPLIASIISVADSYDAMTTDRPYRKALTKEQAIAEIEKYSGRQFHPKIAAALIELYKEGKL
ncbi:MAG: HD domain-containing protein [Candidatus Omnitrophota bacterium]|nr:HD domain-containing protein [Candidatus Omnitrophota bacterium]